MDSDRSQEEVQLTTVAGKREDLQILRVSGPLTIRNFFEFQKLCRELNSKKLIVDLSGVPYLDSAAMGSLVGIHLTYSKDGRKYAIAGANERIKTLFRVCLVDQLLITYPTVEEAEAALA